MTEIRGELPAGLTFVRRTPLFTRDTVPAALLSTHSVKRGTWGLLRVESGRVRYCRDGVFADTRIVPEGGTVLIEPEVPHHVELLDKHTAFFVEFHRLETEA